MEEQADVPKPVTATISFWVLVAIGIVIAALGTWVGVDYAVYHDRIHRGVSIARVDVGGMTPEEATAAVTAAVDAARQSPVQLIGGGTVWILMPDDVGTRMDVAGAVAQAMALTRYDDFLTDAVARSELYFSGREVPLRGVVEAAKLEDLITRLGWEMNRAPLDAGLMVKDGVVMVTEAQNGRAIDGPALTEKLTTLLLSLHSTTVEVPITVVVPEVQAEDNQAALEKAQTMIAGPLLLVGDDRTWTITTEQLADWMEFAPASDNGATMLTPRLSAAKMEPFLDSIAGRFKTAPKNASFKNDGEKAWVVPGAKGTTLDRAATAAAINAAVARTTGRVAEVAVLSIASSLPTEKAEAMGIKDKLGSFTTKYYCPANRQTNVRITTGYATNVFLAPGEEYDFDKRIGPRIPQRGFKLAPGIGANKQMEMVYGGGICQVSTTMFNAVFFAGLQVTERWNHSLYINHYPLGRDATVTDGGKNLRFVNDTGHYIWITGASDGVTTTITIYGTSDGRTVDYKTRGRGGSYVEVERKVTLPDGAAIHTDNFVSVW